MSGANYLQRNLRKVFKVTAAVTFCVGGTAWYYYYSEGQSKVRLGHRGFLNTELSALRVVGTKNCIPNHKLNPGIRVEQEFMHQTQSEDLVEELDMLLREHGANPMTPGQLKFYQTCMEEILETKPAPVEPNMKRCILKARGKLRYAHLPKNLWSIIRAIERSYSYDVGEFKSVTIDYREQGFLWTPPRKNPLQSGENIFLMTVGAFPVVYTFSPSDIPPRKSPIEIAKKSFSNRDLDLLCEPLDLIHISGPARFKRRVGIRMGLKDTEGTRLRSYFGKPEEEVERSDFQYMLTFFFDSGKHSWKDVAVENETELPS